MGSKNKKFVAILFCLLLFIISTGCTNNKDFRNVSWGMTMDEVKNAEKADVVKENKEDKMLTYKVNDIEGLEGIETVLAYKFNEQEKLDSITLLTTGIDKKDGSEIWITLIRKYAKIYGDNPDNKDDYQFTWTTKRSFIEATRLTNDFFAVDFKDINKVDK